MSPISVYNVKEANSLSIERVWFLNKNKGFEPRQEGKFDISTGRLARGKKDHGDHWCAMPGRTTHHIIC